MKTIVLTGMMGCGKTTVGKLLAQNIQCKFSDIDTFIENNEKMTISDIFSHKGEDYFRNLEKSAISEIFQPENIVISLGGGAFENPQIRKFLLNNAKVIYLKTSPEKIFERIKTDNSRPLLSDKMSTETIETILNKRKTNYESAHIIINTDSKTPVQIVEEILK